MPSTARRLRPTSCFSDVVMKAREDLLDFLSVIVPELHLLIKGKAWSLVLLHQNGFPLKLGPRFLSRGQLRVVVNVLALYGVNVGVDRLALKGVEKKTEKTS